MSGGSLVAPVTSTREPWTGSSLADGIEGLVDAIKSEGWVDDVLAGAGLAVEAAATVMDPISALLANGLGWAMEYFDPLREMLDELTGKPDVVASHAQTWINMADELKAMHEELKSHVESDLSEWQGEAADAYNALMENNVEAIGGLSAISAAMASATEGAGGLVEMTREIVRDLIADLVARVIVWAVEAIFVLAKVETELGLVPGTLTSGDTVIAYIKPENLRGLRVPDGNEGGANEHWIPGGYTSGGVPEATINTPADVPYDVIKVKK